MEGARLPPRAARRPPRRLGAALIALRRRTVQDMDAAHEDDPTYCAAYVNDIYANLREAELNTRHRPSTRYMARAAAAPAAAAACEL